MSLFTEHLSSLSLLLLSCSVVSDSLRPHELQHARLPVLHRLLELRLLSTESVMPSNHLCGPLLLLPSIFPSIRGFSNESTLHIRWPKYWSFSFSISPSNEHPGLISFRMDWFELLAVQGTLKSLLQHHSSKESILWCSAFFLVQLSHPYMATGKTTALTMLCPVGQSCVTVCAPQAAAGQAPLSSTVSQRSNFCPLGSMTLRPSVPPIRKLSQGSYAHPSFFINPNNNCSRE